MVWSLRYVLIGLLLFALFFSTEVYAQQSTERTLSKEPTYYKNDLGVIFVDQRTNTFLGTAELSSHKSINEVRPVGLGSQVVMWYDFDFSDNITQGIGNITFKNMRTGQNEIRNYSLVYETTAYQQIPTYQSFVNNYPNGSKFTKEIQNGTETISFPIWEKFESNSIPKGSTRIGLQTEVRLNDYIDAVWEIAGQRVEKHASWTADLNTGLVAYYKLDESSGNFANDSLGAKNLNVSGATLGASGKINTAVRFDGSNDKLNLTAGSFPTGNTARSFNFWFYVHTFKSGDNTNPVLSYGSASTSLMNVIDLQGVGKKIRFWGYNRDFAGNTNLTTGQWYMGTITWNGSLLTIYLNGANDGSSGLGGTLNTASTGVINFGHNTLNTVGYSNITLDEFGVWNRSLSSSEVTQLYNSGAGITYAVDSCTYYSGNWEINLSHYCIVSTNTNLGTNNITWVGTGNITFNATITARDIQALPSNQKGYLTNIARIILG